MTGNPDREKWNVRYRHKMATPGFVAEPVLVLQEFAHLLPASGEALELACGLGANSLMLAQMGLDTSAWDISDVAVEHLRAEARRRGLMLHAEARDLLASPPPPGRFDVVVVSRYLERPLMPAILRALRPGGLLYYQTFVAERVSERGPPDGPYRLSPNELLELCRGLRILAYREEGRVGDPSGGLRDEAYLVGQRA